MWSNGSATSGWPTTTAGSKNSPLMTQKQAIQLFEQRKVRTVWDDDAGKWYVAIVDVVAVLTDSIDAAA